MKVTVQETTYENYGKCVVISNGTAELYVTVDLGPRVIRYGFIGGENVFLNDLDRETFNDDPSIKDYWKHSDRWSIYGGHRLWTSPELMPETYYPDDLPVQWEATEAGAVFTQANQMPLGKQLSIEISMGEGTAVTMVHKSTNTSNTPQEYALWTLSVLAPGGISVLPVPNRETGYLPNRVLSLWPYSNMNDPRVFWGKDYITLRQDTTAETPFKLGLSNEAGAAAYLNRGVCFVKKYDHVMGGNYPDFGVSYEGYTNAKFLESETLGELKTVAPGETISHTERWNLLDFCPAFDPQNEEAIKKIAEQIF